MGPVETAYERGVEDGLQKAIEAIKIRTNADTLRKYEGLPETGWHRKPMDDEFVVSEPKSIWRFDEETGWEICGR